MVVCAWNRSVASNALLYGAVAPSCDWSLEQQSAGEDSSNGCGLGLGLGLGIGIGRVIGITNLVPVQHDLLLQAFCLGNTVHDLCSTTGKAHTLRGPHRD